MSEFDEANAEWARLNAKLKASTPAVKVTMFLLTPFIAVAMVFAFFWGMIAGK